MLVLGGQPFGQVFCASGARGFFGEGYPYHRYWRWLGMDWSGTGFVSKTITTHPRSGNLPLHSDGVTPQERLIPRAMIVKPRTGHILNAIGLSNAGVDWALNSGTWQQRTDHFMISYMSTAPTTEERLAETGYFVHKLAGALPQFRGHVAVQANRACPNTGHLPEEFFCETTATLDILGDLGVPIVVNFNSVVPRSVLVATAAHPTCAALWIGNTIPWGDPHIKWRALFGQDISPLERRKLPVPGGGGLSGPACMPLTAERVRQARRAGITKPIVAGNGIQHPRDVRLLARAGADAIFIGSVAIVRPWRMSRIIQTAHQLF
jgi:dihydroorotate dehydrogenase